MFGFHGGLGGWCQPVTIETGSWRIVATKSRLWREILASGNRQEVTEGQVSKLLWSKGGFGCSMGSELERTECAHWQSISRIVLMRSTGSGGLCIYKGNRLREHSQISTKFRLGCVCPHSTVILRKYFENIPLKSCNIARTFIKLLERFLKCCRNLAMSVQNIINWMLLQY